MSEQEVDALSIAIRRGALNVRGRDESRYEAQARAVLASDWLRDHDAALVAQARRDAAEEALREAADLFACEPHSTEGDESEWAEFCWRCDARVTIRAAAADVIARAGETP